jgi:hypothetical protein
MKLCIAEGAANPNTSANLASRNTDAYFVSTSIQDLQIGVGVALSSEVFIRTVLVEDNASRTEGSDCTCGSDPKLNSICSRIYGCEPCTCVALKPPVPIISRLIDGLDDLDGLP